MIRTLSIVAILATAGAAHADTGHAGHTSKYAGQDSRAIKSLSDDDLTELRRGGGWGLAKAAELNGVPGPAHLLELKDEIGLTPDQVAAINALFEEMRASAIATGERLIEQERRLEEKFRTGTVDAGSLKNDLDAIGRTRAELRYVHLATHLKTPAILTPHQVTRYNALRGYGAGDPCANPPTGHDPAMWRKHNGCD